MLVDIKFNTGNPTNVRTDALKDYTIENLGSEFMVRHHRDGVVVYAKRERRGCYLTYLNFKNTVDLFSSDKVKDIGWGEEKGLLPDGMDFSYGVCDSIDQFMEIYGNTLHKSDKKFCISFSEMRKEDQPPHGGWRWHKWGPYIGNQKRCAEYLYDEPEVEAVFVYEVLHVLDA